MYYDIFFSNPLADHEPGPDGIVVSFPGNKSCVVYAVSDRGDKRLHCLVTDAQLAKLGDDNIAYKFFDKADSVFKYKVRDEDGNVLSSHEWSGHVFNPAGVVYKKNGKDILHRTGQEAPDEGPVE